MFVALATYSNLLLRIQNKNIQKWIATYGMGGKCFICLLFGGGWVVAIGQMKKVFFFVALTWVECTSLNERRLCRITFWIKNSVMDIFGAAYQMDPALLHFL